MRLPAFAGLCVAVTAAGCLAPPAARQGRGTLVVTDGLSNTTEPAPASPTEEYGPDGVRIVRAPTIHEVSAAHPSRSRTQLPAPHRRPTTAPPPQVRTAAELRALVGLREPRDGTLVALEWARQLGTAIDGASIADVIAWGERRNRLADRAAAAMPGDLLVFERTSSDADLDLIGIAIARDARGVTEFLYVAGGVIRRGFVDAARPTTKRDDKQRVVNTFVRHGRRHPPPGTRYLAGELLAHVVHVR